MELSRHSGRMRSCVENEDGRAPDRYERYRFRVGSYETFLAAGLINACARDADGGLVVAKWRFPRIGCTFFNCFLCSEHLKESSLIGRAVARCAAHDGLCILLATAVYAMAKSENGLFRRIIKTRLAIRRFRLTGSQKCRDFEGLLARYRSR